MIYLVLFCKFLIMNESVRVFGRQGPTQEMRHLKRNRGRNSVLVQIFSPRPIIP